MGLRKDLEEAVDKIVLQRAGPRMQGQSCRAAMGLHDEALEFRRYALYADMADSTLLVDNQKVNVAAETYKSYMACAAHIIKDAGGTITAYDGDRVMGIFIGEQKNTSAARSSSYSPKWSLISTLTLLRQGMGWTLTK